MRVNRAGSTPISCSQISAASVVVEVYGHPELFSRQAEYTGEKSQANWIALALEVVTEAEVAEHLEKVW